MVSLSIIVSTNRAPEYLKPLVDSLAPQKSNSSWELIIACNQAEFYMDYQLAQKSGLLGNLPISIVNVPTPGLLAARHAGFQASSGNLCAFTDDDVSFGSDWLSTALELSRSDNPLLATGPSFPVIADQLVIPPELYHTQEGLGQSCGALSLLDFGSLSRKVDPLWVWGLNFVISREWIQTFSGFHPDAYPAEWIVLRGDGECGLTRKIRDAGHSAYYEPGLAVYHHLASKRLEEPYLKKRCFLQGITDAYSNIRYTEDPIPVFPSSTPFSTNNLADSLEQSRLEGMKWYYKHLEINPNLLDWCKLSDYWTAPLPEISNDQGESEIHDNQSYKILLFGSGSAGQRAFEYYHNDHHVVAFVDNNPDRIGSTWKKVDVISPHKLESIEFDFVVICSQFYPEIYKQLVNDIRVSRSKIRLADFLTLHS